MQRICIISDRSRWIGYKYHKEDNKQKERDILKNNILSKYNIPLIRLTTNGSRKESIIRSKLDEIVNNK